MRPVKLKSPHVIWTKLQCKIIILFYQLTVLRENEIGELAANISGTWPPLLIKTKLQCTIIIFCSIDSVQPKSLKQVSWLST
jgi:hypothetical protein